MVLEKTLESPLDCKDIQPVHPKGDQSWVFIGRTNAEAETPILWPPHAKNWYIGKDSDAGRDWGQEEKGMTEDEMAGWHHRLDGHEFEWTPGVGDGQGGLVCCDSWGRKESDTTEWLNWMVSKTLCFYILFLFVGSLGLVIIVEVSFQMSSSVIAGSKVLWALLVSLCFRTLFYFFMAFITTCSCLVCFFHCLPFLTKRLIPWGMWPS